MSSRILTFGHDPTLQRTRELLLHHDGFDVVTAANGLEAARVLEHQHFDLLILCHTIREQERSSFLSLFHASDHPAKVLVLFTGTSPLVEPGCDSVFCTFDGPGTLLAAVHGLTDDGYSTPATAA
ncbi:MAG TPA: hypothetical protein VGM11_06665 [Acidobacteriaceae bacterium]|jgi:DNA-binding NtrC family response regulator